MRRLRVHVAGSGWSVLSLIGEGAAGAWGSRNERGRRTALDLDASSTTVWAAVDGDRHVVAAHRDTYMPVTWPNMLHKDVVSDESQQQRFARVLANKVSEEVEGMPVELRADDVVRLVDVVGGLVEEIARCWAWMPNDEWEVKGAKEESWTLG